MNHAGIAIRMSGTNSKYKRPVRGLFWLACCVINKMLSMNIVIKAASAAPMTIPFHAADQLRHFRIPNLFDSFIGFQNARIFHAPFSFTNSTGKVMISPSMVFSK